MILSVLRDKDDSGKKSLPICLTGENITRLVAGEPILFSPNKVIPELPENISIGIVYGKTEEDLIKMLQEHTHQKLTIE